MVVGLERYIYKHQTNIGDSIWHKHWSDMSEYYTMLLQIDITNMSAKVDEYEPSGSKSYFLNADFEDNFMNMKCICILDT